MKASFAMIAASSFAALCFLAVPAEALCYYTGEHFTKAKDGDDFDRRLYATTTLMDEFQDSTLVVHPRVLSEKDYWPKDEDTNQDLEASVVYRLQVNQVFKGHASKILLDYTERNSGGFYLDVGQEYLLFLSPEGDDKQARTQAPGGYEVNYNCGQSRLWSDVPGADRDLLNGLAVKALKGRGAP